MRTVRVMDVKRCAVCERTLLLGERSIRFAPEGNHEFVDVCQLCQDAALDHGWVREGDPLGPAVSRNARRRRTLSLGGIFSGQRPPAAESIVAEPILRRLTDDEQAMVEAAALFNASDAVRTIEGIARSLGDPQVSIVVLSGSSPDIVVTFVWDLAWYQYRVNRKTAQPLRLTDRGTEPDEVAENFRDWNARFETGTGVVPDLQTGD
jgi:hypothetical protein